MTTCTICGTTFTATRPDARYCGPRCRQRASRASRHTSQSQKPPAPKRLTDYQRLMAKMVEIPGNDSAPK
jgi:hypothetical protein